MVLIVMRSTSIIMSKETTSRDRKKHVTPSKPTGGLSLAQRVHGACTVRKTRL